MLLLFLLRLFFSCFLHFLFPPIKHVNLLNLIKILLSCLYHNKIKFSIKTVKCKKKCNIEYFSKVDKINFQFFSSNKRCNFLNM